MNIQTESNFTEDETFWRAYMEETERQAQLRDEEMTQRFLAEKQSNDE